MEVRLLFTRHEDLGQCNSDALQEILTALKPDTVFIELPSILFDDYFSTMSRQNLESIAVNRYLEKHQANLSLVDSNEIPTEDFFKEYENILKVVSKSIKQYGFDYRTFTDRQNQNISRYGFKYLNSEQCQNVNDEINATIKHGLYEIGNNGLSKTFQMFIDINEKRESHMISEIYQYGRNNRFEKAIFLVGAAHRKSIIQKIDALKEQNRDSIYWQFYS